MFVQNNKLVEFSMGKDKTQNRKEFNIENGLMGRCVKLRRSIIIADVNMSNFFNSNVDIKTLMSVICVPIIQNEKRFLSSFLIFFLTFFKAGKDQSLQSSNQFSPRNSKYTQRLRTSSDRTTSSTRI